MKVLTLLPLPQLYAICRLECLKPLLEDAVSQQAQFGPLYALSVTADEISLICTQDKAEALQPLCGGQFDFGWKAFRLAGTFAFDQVGILAGISTVLAQAEVGIMAVSTFDTDYILVKQENWDKARQAVIAAGYAWGEEK